MRGGEGFRGLCLVHADWDTIGFRRCLEETDNKLARCTFGAEHLLARPGQGDPMVAFLAVAHGVVLHLGAGRVLIRKSASRAIETLLPESFS